MIQVFCQWLMIAQLCFGLLSSVHSDFNGVKERKPGGFAGFVSTLLIGSAMIAVWIGAGVFDHLAFWNQ